MESPNRKRWFLLSIQLFCGLVVLLALWRVTCSLYRSPEAPTLQATPGGDVPHFFTRARPRDYTAETFTGALRPRLLPEEVLLVVNPLASTPEMKRWALKLTTGATNDLQKARVLYDTVAARFSLKPAAFAKPPTAQEVFAAWRRPEAAFACQDFAFLYDALARDVGLMSFHVSVEEDCYETKLSHSCAAVFIAGKALLVDPAYLSFGATHRRFTVLDDLQTAALYLCGSQDLRLLDIACKLAPGLLAPHMSLFDTLAREGRWSDAQGQVAQMVRLDPAGPMTRAAQARIAAHFGDSERGIALLLSAIKIAPQTAPLHASLGTIYAQEGRWALARESYQNALHYSAYEKEANAASHGVAFMGAMESQQKGDWDGVVTNCDKAIQLRPDYVEAYLARGSAKQVKGDVDGALADYNRAIQLQPGLAPAYLGRGTQKYAKGDLDGAMADYAKAVGLSSKMAPAWKMLGWIHYNRRQFAEALDAFRRCCELEPGEDYAHFRIWLARSRLGETAEATEELQTYLGSRQARLTKDWSSRVGSFLAGHTAERDFLDAAQGDQGSEFVQHSDAWFYAGTKRLLLGDRATAASYFEKCIAAHEVTLIEYWSAIQELRFLRGERP